MFGQKVRRSSELERILRLPRKQPYPENLVERLTEILRTPQGTQTLKPIQAQALYEIATNDGLFANITVGGGKTLITLLAALMLDDVENAFLISRSSLLRKTRRDLAEYEKHWRIPQIQTCSYETLSNLKQKCFLEKQRPNVLIFDEGQKAKNKGTALTKRIIRYLKANPNTRVIVLTGTSMKKSIRDFAHLMAWCLKAKCPLPLNYVDLEEWANCIDDRVNELSQFEPGALSVFANGSNDIIAVRQGVRDWIANTPGVIMTQGRGEEVPADLIIRPIFYDVPKHIDEAFDKLRNKNKTPDDWDLKTAPEVWMHARQLALGLYYAWEPRPPDWWRNPRREWAACVRETLANYHRYDSELDIVNSIDRGELKAAKPFLDAWRAVRDKFEHKVVDRWCDDTAVGVCLEWMKEPGIVWVKHTLFGERLAQLSGCKYYGPQGLARDGEFIDDADPTKAIIASVDANKEGRNLQKKFYRNLITALDESPADLEQLMARTHRPFVAFDTIYVDILCGCKEHVNAMNRAIAASEVIRDTTGAEYKVLSADIEWPDDDELAQFEGHRWR